MERLQQKEQAQHSGDREDEDVEQDHERIARGANWKERDNRSQRRQHRQIDRQRRD